MLSSFSVAGKAIITEVQTTHATKRRVGVAEGTSAPDRIAGAHRRGEVAPAGVLHTLPAVHTEAALEGSTAAEEAVDSTAPAALLPARTAEAERYYAACTAAAAFEAVRFRPRELSA